MAAEICFFLLKLTGISECAPSCYGPLYRQVLSTWSLILVGLALVVGSTDAMALKEQQNILNCLDEFCPVLYLYDSNNGQVEYKESYNNMVEMDMIWAVSVYTTRRTLKGLVSRWTLQTLTLTLTLDKPCHAEGMEYCEVNLVLSLCRGMQL